MSLIKYKIGKCPICNDDIDKTLISGKCQYHYWSSRPNKKQTKIQKPKSNKLSDTSVSELLKLAVIVFNKYIRNRDLNNSLFFTCISCNKTKHYTLCQCGHYMPSTYSALKFNEDNCHAECETCNCHDPDHLIKYRRNLIKKIGLEKVQWLESHRIANTHKWTKEELKEIINKYKT